MMASLQCSQAFLGNRVEFKGFRVAPSRKVLVVKSLAQGEGAEATCSRRAAFGVALGAVSLLAGAQSSQAAYGEAARVFGSKPTNSTGFVPYEGAGFKLLLPSKWEPTQERDSADVQVKYQDTYPVNNLAVFAKKTSASSIKDFGSPGEFLEKHNYLFGENVWGGNSRSEGGFKPNTVSSASVLESEVVTGADGKPHVQAHVLTRTADGNEGGRHQYVSAAVDNGKLYILKVQIGEKRYNKGGARDAKAALESFAV
jgi:hypothetical protein